MQDGDEIQADTMTDRPTVQPTGRMDASPKSAVSWRGAMRLHSFSGHSAQAWSGLAGIVDGLEWSADGECVLVGPEKQDGRGADEEQPHSLRVDPPPEDWEHCREPRRPTRSLSRVPRRAPPQECKRLLVGLVAKS